MIRKYALVVFDNTDTIIDRYNLDITTAPTGNGFQLKLDYVSTDIEDIITKVVQQKATRVFNVIQYQNSYTRANSLTNWIQKYSTTKYCLALEYNDTQVTKYCEGKVTGLTKTEKDEYGVLTQQLTFTMLTPDFIKRENTIKIQPSNIGKKYPFKYSYSYGTSIVENNEIDNPYILDVPLIVTVYGGIATPTIQLLDENGNSYNKVKFTNTTLTTGEKIIINSAQRKIIKTGTDGTEIDYSAETDPSSDTFLRANNGLSKLSVNIEDITTGFKIIGSWRQYTL